MWQPIFILLFCLLTMVGCNDSKETIADNGNPANTTPPVAEQPQCEPSYLGPLEFAGIKGVDGISFNALTLYWQQNSDAKSYLLFQVVNQETIHLATLPEKASSYRLKGLRPDTRYQLKLMAMDAHGLLTHTVTPYQVSTLPLPLFANTHALHFAGKKQYLSSSASNKLLPKNDFSISLWFKTTSAQRDARLITFHREQRASSALTLALDREYIVLGYREAGRYRKIKSSQKYNNGEWHHLFISYTNETLKLYYDASLIGTIKSKLDHRGSFPMTVASFDGRSRFYQGNIDELSLWKAGLNHNDIKTIYNKGWPAGLFSHTKEEKLTHWWRMGENLRSPKKPFLDIKGSAKAQFFHCNESCLITL